MENTERSEALAAIDIIAEEIHNEYAKVGEQTGHKLPAWKDTPEAAKSMPRTLARLMMSKLQAVYDDASKKAKATAAAAPPPLAAAPKQETLGEKAIVLENLTKVVEEAVARLIDKQAIAKEGNPITKGVDAAIMKVVEKLAIDVLISDADVQEALKEQITESIKTGLFGDGEEKDE